MNWTPQQYRDLIARGKCPACPDQRKLAPNRRKCAICLERAKIVKRRHRVRHGYGTKVCNVCGAIPPAPGHRHCYKCLEAERIRSVQLRRTRRLEKKCVKCGGWLNENELIIGRLTCFGCMEQVVERKLI